VAVVHALQDLLDAVRRVRLRVELPGHDVLKELSTRDAGVERIDIFLFVANTFRLSPLVIRGTRSGQLWHFVFMPGAKPLPIRLGPVALASHFTYCRNIISTYFRHF
jgi:hypothetical protein